MFKVLLSSEDFASLLKEIDYQINKLDAKINTVSLDTILHRIGFPDNYKNIINM